MAEPITNLLDGRYTFVFTDMSSIIKVPKDKQDVQSEDIELPAVLKIKDSDIVIQTSTPDGTSPTMFGKIEGTNIIFWMSGFERNHTVTYHLTGVLLDNNSASGDLSIFMNHEKAANGKWSLTKNK